MVAAPLTLATLLMLAAAPKSVMLTPETMADHNFFIECVLFDQTTNESSRPTPATGPIRVNVHFDPMKGPAIKAFKSSAFEEAAFLVVRDGDEVLLSVPVEVKPFDGNQGGLYVRFWTNQDLLPKTQLVLDTEGPGSFTVDLKAFTEKK